MALLIYFFWCCVLDVQMFSSKKSELSTEYIFKRVPAKYSTESLVMWNLSNSRLIQQKRFFLFVVVSFWKAISKAYLNICIRTIENNSFNSLFKSNGKIAKCFGLVSTSGIFKTCFGHLAKCQGFPIHKLAMKQHVGALVGTETVAFYFYISSLLPFW